MTAKMHADEVDIDETLVKQLLLTQFPKWAELPLKRVASSGTDNALYRLGEDMVVRLPRIPGAVKHVEKEQKWLPILAPGLPLTIPTPLALGKPAEDYPWQWSIYKWIEGENPKTNSIHNIEAFIGDLTNFISALHEIDAKGGPIARRGVPLRERDEDTRSAISELQGMVDTNKVISVWEEALKVPNWSGSPVWVHGDIMPFNILVKDGKLSAIIDFGTMGIGDPACDLIVAWNLLPASSRDLFRTELGVDDDTWRRGRGWALSVALIQLPYYKDTNPVLADNARHVISEVLSSF